MTTFRQLTFDGVNDLYLTPFGAHTLKDYWALCETRKNLDRKPNHVVLTLASDEMEMRNERCIDEHGVGMY